MKTYKTRRTIRALDRYEYVKLIAYSLVTASKEWGILVWYNVIFPVKSVVIWKVLHNRLPTNKDASTFLGIQNSFYAEVVGAILAIKHYGFIRLWLKTDSSLLCQVFSSSDLISLLIRGRWRNCLKISKRIDFKVTHISEEENECVDKRANLRLDNKLSVLGFD
uniref:RNase H type-1 domain-containing protein n=1 Tax=Phaseolus vulgaris TaxID=3885 RepID=V7C3E0_PHAVU|nr:hypothetical protein PHAVU_004G045700g [Phaseolus vulgaris]ESW23426.1 hypothetical protein PHAVU_004G045700g [Phaseolus vulgaris]